MLLLLLLLLLLLELLAKHRLLKWKGIRGRKAIMAAAAAVSLLLRRLLQGGEDRAAEPVSRTSPGTHAATGAGGSLARARASRRSRTARAAF